MAVSSKECVRIATADGDVIPGQLRIKMIRIIAGGSGCTLNLKSDGVTGGTVLYSAVLAANGSISDYPDGIQIKGDLYVNFSAGGGTVFLYCE